MNTGESLRAYMDTQGAGAWHKLVPGNKAGRTTSMFVPMDRPATPEELLALREAASAGGMTDAIDTGQGVTLTRFYPDRPERAPQQKAVRGGLMTRLGEIVPDAGAIQRVDVDSGYLGYEGTWEQGVGSGAATRQLFEQLDAEPALAARLDASPAIRQAAAARLQRNADWAARTGTPAREDVQNALRIIQERGISGLREAMKSGAVLPAIGAAALLPLLQQEEGSQAPS